MSNSRFSRPYRTIPYTDTTHHTDDILNSIISQHNNCETIIHIATSVSDLVYDLTEVTGIETSQRFAVRWEGLTRSPPLIRSGPRDKVGIC